MSSIKVAVSILICILIKNCSVIVINPKKTKKTTSLVFCLLQVKMTPTKLCVFRAYINSKWDLEVIGSPENSGAVLKAIPLAHPVGLPEKCTYCITDQLTLSAVPHNDWRRTLRKLQTFTGADKTRFSHLTQVPRESLQLFHAVIKCSRYFCEPWWIRPSFLSERRAWKQAALAVKQSKREAWNKQPF